MNFFEAALMGSVEEMYIDAQSFRVLVLPERAKELRDYLPEFPPNITAGRVKAQVDVTELVGDTIEAVLNMDNIHLVENMPSLRYQKMGLFIT